MDGNGRWAAQNGVIRAKGHSEGAQAAKRCVKSAIACHVKYLSLYIFSTENWNRSAEEVDSLLNMILDIVRKEEAFYVEYGIRIIHSGAKERMSQRLIDEIAWVEERTKVFDNIIVNIAINYGGRDEIVRAVNRLCRDNTCRMPISATKLCEYMDVPLLPDPDLIIRTGGEYRLSNFLLWGSAYSELYFCDKLWPDWQDEDLKIALAEYSVRKRSFGGKSISS